MTDDFDRGDLQAALALLSERSYGEEGIPMIVVLENKSDFIAGVDPCLGRHGRLLREAGKASGDHECEPDDAFLARLIEWVADRAFGPAALAQAGIETRDA